VASVVRVIGHRVLVMLLLAVPAVAVARQPPVTCTDAQQPQSVVDAGSGVPGARRLAGTRRTFDCDVDGRTDGACSFVYCVPDRPRDGFLHCVRTYGLLVNQRRRVQRRLLRCLPAPPPGV